MSAAARSVNSIMTETYWEVGRRIVEEEQEARPGRLRGASHRAIVPGPDQRDLAAASARST